MGGDPKRDQEGGFQVYELAGLPRLASARLVGEYPIARVEFEDPELPVRSRSPPSRRSCRSTPTPLVSTGRWRA